ncbi:MAG: isoprenylcysteine carboxylmethyltransferase family protein [Gemmatimonadaceae bacterium]|nr:isoprenylcysteine carboxylmethyltransferase family protein [Gemmatimonadaceae bacterium]
MGLPLAIRAPLATVIPLTVAGFVPWLLLDQTLPRGVTPWRLVFLLPMAAGLLLGLWSVVLFAVTGRGTLAPVDPPDIFVARGPYRVTRNPMYVGVVLWLVGLAALSGGRMLAWYAFAVLAWLHLFVVLVEEPGLRRRFGGSYESYARNVPRWLGRRRGTFVS